MSKQYDNELKGVLFVNDKKVKDTDPNYNGSATIDGVEYWMSGWKKTSKEGKSFLSLSFQLKDAGAGQRSGSPAPQRGNQRPARDDSDFPS